VVPFQLRRLGIVMEPEPDNSHEVEGVLNPAAARSPSGELYLFPRLVARGNYSRIGIARVRFDDAGDPIGVERLGIALEPEAEYETRADGGGCEDPRITFSARGPRIALAVSEDLFRWRRLGLATFEPYDGLLFNDVNNKDALVFALAVPNPSGQPALALLHRPLFPGTEPRDTIGQPTPRTVDLHRESIWISYCPVGTASQNLYHLCRFSSHYRLACPVAPWERLKIGGGAPPMLTSHGWLVFYHGVSGSPELQAAGRAQGLRYSAGVLVLDRYDPHVIHYRSPTPVLSPELPEEREGIVADVVFPTAVDRRTDLGQPDRLDVYYGMADSRIGVARLDLPESLPPEARADPDEGKV
jgi:beta-1,2-mannobiose phosphorylase / 1,2-beta-oligomannan phosphorylase